MVLHHVSNIPSATALLGLTVDCCSADSAATSTSTNLLAGLNSAAGVTGDMVKDGDVIAQIETDKVTIDVRYTEAKPGKLKEVLISADDTVNVGQAVCTVEQVPSPESGAHWKRFMCVF